METAVQCSCIADVTVALEKLRQGNVDETRRRNRNGKKTEDNRKRRSLSPGLCRSYDWNTTHFYPDIHEENEPDACISTRQGMQRTVRFASDRESGEGIEGGVVTELEGEDERGGYVKEEWRRAMREKDDCEDESKQYASSSDDFEEWNSFSDNDSDRNGPKVRATPVVKDRQVEIGLQGRRSDRGHSPAGQGQPGLAADLLNYGVGQNGRWETDHSRIRIEPRQSANDYDETELDAWTSIADDSKWKSDRPKCLTEHQRTNTHCEKEDKPACNDWSQWEFIDEDSDPSIPSMKSATHVQCSNGKSDHQAFKSTGLDFAGSDDNLQNATEAALTQELAIENSRKGNGGLSQTRGIQGQGQKPKPHHQKGICMITHFDDLWPVSELGSDYSDESKRELPTFKSADESITPKEQYISERKSLRSILKQNKVTGVPANTEPLERSERQEEEPSQSNTLPNLHRVVGSTASCSASIVDDRGEAKKQGTWSETGDNGTDAQEKRWKSESFLFLEDARSQQQSRDRKRKRFVIDYSCTSTGHVTSTGNDERKNIGPLTLNEFEMCLEIPAAQLHVMGISPEMKDEEDWNRKMEAIRMELPAISGGIREPVTGKNDFSVSGRDPSSDLFWLFHRVRTSDSHSWKGSRNPCTESQSPQNSLATARAPSFHATDLEYSARTEETSAFPSSRPTQKTGSAIRQQYRWSTAIREPHARILLDQWDPEPPLSLIPPPTNRYRIVRPDHEFLTKYSTTYADGAIDSAANVQNERAFTIAGQPAPSTSFRNRGNAGQPTTKFALVGISRQDRYTAPQLEDVSKDWQNEGTSTRLADTVGPGLINQKHRYLRERVLTEAAVDFNPELMDQAPVDPVLSRSDSAYRSLQKLEQLRLESGARGKETWDSHSSKSLFSLPSNLPRQRNADMASVGSIDSAGKTSDARLQGVQRILGRRGNACAVVSPMRQHPSSQTQDASEEESTSIRSVSTTELSDKVEIRGSTQFAESKEPVTNPVAKDHRANNFRTNKKIHQTPRAVKARHEMKARRVKGSD